MAQLVHAGEEAEVLGAYSKVRSLDVAGQVESAADSSLLLPTITLLSPLFTGVHPTVVVLGSPFSLRPKNWFLQEIRPITTCSPLLIVTHRTPPATFTPPRFLLALAHSRSGTLKNIK